MIDVSKVIECEGLYNSSFNRWSNRLTLYVVGGTIETKGDWSSWKDLHEKLGKAIAEQDREEQEQREKELLESEE